MASDVMPANMMLGGARRPGAFQPGGAPGGNMSTSHRDLTDHRYKELRRPRKVTFFCNGDRYFKVSGVLLNL